MEWLGRILENWMNIEECMEYAQMLVGGQTSADRNRARKELRACIESCVAAERERCKQAVRDTKDKSGVNDDGRSWLMRASRGDFIAAIDAL